MIIFFKKYQNNLVHKITMMSNNFDTVIAKPLEIEITENGFLFNDIFINHNHSYYYFDSDIHNVYFFNANEFIVEIFKDTQHILLFVNLNSNQIIEKNMEYYGNLFIYDDKMIIKNTNNVYCVYNKTGDFIKNSFKNNNLKYMFQFNNKIIEYDEKLNCFELYLDTENNISHIHIKCINVIKKDDNILGINFLNKFFITIGDAEILISELNKNEFKTYICHDSEYLYMTDNIYIYKYSHSDSKLECEVTKIPPCKKIVRMYLEEYMTNLKFSD